MESAGPTAAPGNYAVEVQQLARAEKFGSAAFADSITALNTLDPAFQGGTFSINGREVVIAADANLGGVRDAINAANTGAEPSGVTASILMVGPGEHRLILTSTVPGSAGVRLADVTPGALAGLGISTVSRSAAFADTASSLASLLGLSSPPAVRTIVIEGREVVVDLVNDSLQSLLAKVRSAATEAGEDPDQVANLVSDADGTRLEVRGSVSARVDDADTRAILNALGFTRDGLATAGTDATVLIDGFEVTRSTNTIADAVAGVSFALQGAEAGTTVEVAVARDVESMTAAVKEFADAYNELLAFVNTQRAQNQPLAHNSTLRGAMASFTRVVLTPIEGLDTAFERAAQIGLSLSRTGQLTVDEARLKTALETNPADVKALFAGQGGDLPVEGLGARMLAAAGGVTRLGDGSVAIQLQSLERSIGALTRRQSDAEARLEVRRATLLQQFARMESALGSLNAQGDWLKAQVDALKPRDR